MKKFLTAMLAVFIALSVMAGCTPSEEPGASAPDGADKPAEMTVDHIDLKTLMYLFSDMSEVENLSHCTLSEVPADGIGGVVGDYGFTAEFSEGMMLAPLMNVTPFTFAAFRVDGDAEAFAEALKAHAVLNKWVCVAAQTAMAVACENTVIFAMCKKNEAEALKDTFAEICKPGFRPEEHLNAPLKGLTAQNVYDAMTETYHVDGYGFLDGKELGTSVQNMPNGFEIPAAVRHDEIVWDLSETEGDEWDPARSAFTAILRVEGGDPEAASHAHLLYEALETIELPLGDEPDCFVAYSAEYGVYFLFAGAGSWKYFTFDLGHHMESRFRMDVYTVPEA